MSYGKGEFQTGATFNRCSTVLHVTRNVPELPFLNYHTYHTSMNPLSPPHPKFIFLLFFSPPGSLVQNWDKQLNLGRPSDAQRMCYLSYSILIKCFKPEDCLVVTQWSHLGWLQPKTVCLQDGRDASPQRTHHQPQFSANLNTIWKQLFHRRNVHIVHALYSTFCVSCVNKSSFPTWAGMSVFWEDIHVFSFRFTLTQKMVAKATCILCKRYTHCLKIECHPKIEKVKLYANQ